MREKILFNDNWKFYRGKPDYDNIVPFVYSIAKTARKLTGPAAVSCPESLKNLIANTGISAVLCGHTHHCFAGTFLGKPYYTANCMSFYGTNLEAGLVKFEEKYGYNYYETRKGQILRSCQETFSDNKLIEIVDWR